MMDAACLSYQKNGSFGYNESRPLLIPKGAYVWTYYNIDNLQFTIYNTDVFFELYETF